MQPFFDATALARFQVAEKLTRRTPDPMYI
jgi:hypothetical protein